MINKRFIKEDYWFKLKIQFSLVVIVAILIGFLLIIGIISLLEPFVNNKLSPIIEENDQQLTAIENELFQLVHEQDIYIVDNRVPEIEQIFEKHPRYKFEYITFLNTDVEELNKSSVTGEITVRSYANMKLSVKNGSVIVGVTIPEVLRISAIVIVCAILFFLLILLLIVGYYVGRKTRYLQRMASKLEMMAGGDLDIRVPIKGHDEMTQLAWHINQMAASLKEMIQKEKRADHTQKQLITNISHDLRTPLTAIQGYLSLIENMDPGLEGDQIKKYIQLVYRKSEGVSHLVEQLFDYVLLSNHQMEFKQILAEPSLLWHQLFADSEGIVASKNIEVQYQLNTVGQKLLVDTNQLKRVTENLMQNLKKYGRADSKVTIEGLPVKGGYELKIINEAEGKLEDYGQDFLNMYFTTDRISGKSAGLGLAICKEIIEQHKGTFGIKIEGNLFITSISIPFIEEVRAIESND
ncbi:MAG: HAMP domain-containing histidine kinase [Vallitaleaceae bacterium]|nr:HAMP domain-containing histidine kinase [Vallitaleaceae bacterium]